MSVRKLHTLKRETFAATLTVTVTEETTGVANALLVKLVTLLLPLSWWFPSLFLSRTQERKRI